MDTGLSYTPSQTALTDPLSGAPRVGITVKSYLSQSLILKENNLLVTAARHNEEHEKLGKTNEPPRSEEVAVLKEVEERSLC